MKEIVLKFKVVNNSILKEELRLNISRKYYRHLKSINASFYVNGILSSLNSNVTVDDEIIVVAYEEENKSEWPYLDMQLDIRFENDNYLIVNKPKSLLTIPTKSEPKSLYQLLTQYLNQKEIHILNRLDKETRGLVVVAKNRYAAYLLQPTHEHMERRYLCLVHGIVKDDGRIENYIEKSEEDNKRKITDDKEKGKIAISNFKVIERYEDTTLLEFILETGRTHQIRLHCSNMAHPIVGDSMYGVDMNQDLMLKSYRVIFDDPYTKEKIDISLIEKW